MKKDAAVIKILTELGLRKIKDLSEEEQLQYDIATDEDTKFLDDLRNIFEFNDPKREDPKNFATTMTALYRLNVGDTYHFSVEIDSNYTKAVFTLKNVDSGEIKMYNMKYDKAVELKDYQHKKFNPFIAQNRR